MQKIHVTQHDCQRLLQVLHERLQHPPCEDYRLRELFEELHNTEPLPLESIPSDIITMNSRISLTEEGSGQQMEVELVYPAEGSMREGRVSVLTTLGRALLGSRVGHVVVVEDASGHRCYRVGGLSRPVEALA